VHLGILVIALGVTGSQAWSLHTEATLRRGETTELAGYRLRFDGLSATEESNHFRVAAAFLVTDRGGRTHTMHPAKKFYPQEQSPIASVDYRPGLREDLYLVLGDFARDGSEATIKVQINRLVSWIWIGGGVLTLGALLSILPERKTATAVVVVPRGVQTA
jgi:cytochrome c-type biogenesis protein CcmF